MYIILWKNNPAPNLIFPYDARTYTFKKNPDEVSELVTKLAASKIRCDVIQYDGYKDLFTGEQWLEQNTIPANVMTMVETSFENMKNGIVSQPIDLEQYCVSEMFE